MQEIPEILSDGDGFTIAGQHLTRARLEAMRDQIIAALAANPPAPTLPQEPKKVWSILHLSDGRIAVNTPYSDLVVAECKRLMGKWGTVTGKGWAWLLAGEHEAHIRSWLADLYDAPTVEKIITFDSGEESHTHAPDIDGASIVTFTRDHRGRIDHPAIVEIIEDHLRSGGSARYPTLRGKLVVRARIREQAQVFWGRASWTTITDPQ